MSREIENKQSMAEIVAEIQKRLDATRDPNEIDKILNENSEYLLMLKVPFIIPDIPSCKNDNSEDKNEDKNENSGKIETSQSVKNSSQSKIAEKKKHQKIVDEIEKTDPSFLKKSSRNVSKLN